ncbi:hypothetical protein F965_00492 [Acinetobacter schindleri NIPH 900]|uniref:BIG2 domain-containing protein n=1 Tax=Acinetobacter schindleri NIPH 900 TaxID=1217675 RepID=N8XYW1_9GAMM|nr:Ig-like domain-containing protein [Acinetobacter schindleri]ENV14249.1 hypothetical protein F965_00492 [Acinetobacter schindleri NIPH 900]
MKIIDLSNPVLLALGDSAVVRELSFENISGKTLYEPLTKTTVLANSIRVVHISSEIGYRQVATNVEQINRMNGKTVLKLKASIVNEKAHVVEAQNKPVEVVLPVGDTNTQAEPKEAEQAENDVNDEVVIAISYLSISTKTNNLDVGDDRQLKLSKKPSDATQEVVWSSTDSTVASVDEDGTVTAHKQGKVTITAKVKDGEVKANTTVVVR